MSPRRPRGSLSVEVLDALVAECEHSGAPPPASLIGERIGVAATQASRALRQLADEGAVAQPHGERGAYIPLRRSDGTPVAMRLVDVKAEAEQDVLVELVGKIPGEKRAEVERFIRFVIEQD